MEIYCLYLLSFAKLYLLFQHTSALSKTGWYSREQRAPCLQNFVYDDQLEVCVYVSQNTHSYINADTICKIRTFGIGHLLLMKSIRLGNFVKDNNSRYGQTEYWIGMAKDPNNGGELRWADGTVVDHSNWDGGISTTCVKSKDEKWKEESCSTLKHYICQHHPLLCPLNFIYDAGSESCFYASGKLSEVSRNTALDKCKELAYNRGHLPYTKSTDILTFISTNLFSEDLGYDWFWLGMEPAGAYNTFHWQDQTIVTWTKWDQMADQTDYIKQKRDDNGFRGENTDSLLSYVCQFTPDLRENVASITRGGTCRHGVIGRELECLNVIDGQLTTETVTSQNSNKFTIYFSQEYVVSIVHLMRTSQIRNKDIKVTIGTNSYDYIKDKTVRGLSSSAKPELWDELEFPASKTSYIIIELTLTTSYVNPWGLMELRVFGYAENQPITCERLGRLGYASGLYGIDIDGVNGPAKPFAAWCDMANAATYLSPGVKDTHTFVTEQISVSCSTNCNSPQQLNISYMLGQSVYSVNPMPAVRNQSLYCTQSLSLTSCSGVGPVDTQGNLRSFWVSADGQVMRYWPGGAFSGGCSCGSTRSCTYTGSICNCDGNSAVTSSDNGTVFASYSLPVQSMTFISAASTYQGAIQSSRVMCKHTDDICKLMSPKQRYQCGWQGLQEAECLAIGCCYDSTTSECFAKHEGVLPKNCEILRGRGYDSDFYVIDLDGAGGVRPLRVQCLMETEPATEVIPLQQSVDQKLAACTDPGCNVIDVLYTASREQMSALTSVSAQCSQVLGLKCLNAPIYDNVTNQVMTWWDDIEGNPAPYWTGNSTWRCACGQYGYCLNPNKSCNCDAQVDTQLSDTGILTDKDRLPVTRLRVSGQEAHTMLGPLKCQSNPCDAETEIGAKLWPIAAFSSERYTSGRIDVFDEPRLGREGYLTKWHFVAKSAGEVGLAILASVTDGFKVMAYYRFSVRRAGLQMLTVPIRDRIKVSGNYRLGLHFPKDTTFKLATDTTQGGPTYYLLKETITVDDTVPITNKFYSEVLPSFRVEIDTGKWNYNKENHKCYIISSDQVSNYNIADLKCVMYGGNLLTIDNYQEMTMVANHVNDGSYFVGLKNSRDQAIWDTLSPLQFTNFSAVAGQRRVVACPGETVLLDCRNQSVIRVLWANYGRTSTTVCQPPFHYGSGSCISESSMLTVMDSCHGRHNCSLTSSPAQFGVICQGQAHYLEVHYDCLKITPCPPGFSDYFQGSCYAIRSNLASLADQITGCNSLYPGARPADIEFEDELSHVFQVNKLAGAQDAYVGLIRADGMYWWSDSKRKMLLSTSYVVAASGQTCHVLSGTNKTFVSINCNDQRKAICEYKVAKADTVLLTVTSNQSSWTTQAPSTKANYICQKEVSMDKDVQCLNFYDFGSSVQCPEGISEMVNCYCPCINGSGAIKMASRVCTCPCYAAGQVVMATCCSPPLIKGLERQIELECINYTPSSNNAPTCPPSHTTAMGCMASSARLYASKCTHADATAPFMRCCRLKDRPSFDGLVSSQFKVETNSGDLTAGADWRVSYSALSGCMQLCHERPACRFLSHNSSNNNCYMATSAAALSTGSRSVYRKRTNPADLFQIKNMWSEDDVVSMYARELTSLPLGQLDLTTCAQSCVETTGCASVFLTENGICYSSPTTDPTCVLLTQNASSYLSIRDDRATATMAGFYWSLECSSKTATTSEATCERSEVTSCDCGEPVSEPSVSGQRCLCTGSQTTTVYCCQYVLRTLKSPLVCPPGTVVEGNMCTPCTNLTVSSNLNGVSCHPCPDGFFPDKLGSYCSVCPKGSVTSDNKTTCEPCPSCYDTASDGASTCIPVDCGVPPNLTLAIKTYQNSTYLHNATYQCHLGYIQNGTLSSQCQCNATWSIVTGFCQPLECPAPPVVGNATRSGDNFTLSASVQYNCSLGFHLAGGSSKQCSPYGNWTGDVICIETDECSSNPCMNHATCLDLINSFNCSCLPGYDGKLCENDIDECQLGHQCKNGTCVDAVNNYTCSCIPGFTGTLCDIDIDDCLSGPCQNGGTCQDKVNSYSCICTDGFGGQKCQLVKGVNECENSPCLNGGTCTDLELGYNCTCLAGFSGFDCEINVDECQSQPCQQNGTCKDGINDISCVCVPGYSGKLCQAAVDCGEPPPVMGSTWSAPSTTYNQQAVYTCSAGYERAAASPEGTKLCNVTGTWDGENIICQGPSDVRVTPNPSTGVLPECLPALDIDFAVRDKDVIYAGAVITYKCQSGYWFYGSRVVSLSIECMYTGQWSIDMKNQKCIKLQCPTIVQPAGTLVIGYSREYDSVVTYMCLPGYFFFDGTTLRTTYCTESGQWSNPIAACYAPSCPAIRSNAMTVTVNESKAGETVLTCTPPTLFANGAPVSRNFCTSKNVWANNYFMCDISCPAVPFVHNATISSPATPIGTRVTVSCLKGHRFPDGFSKKMIECLSDQSWNDTLQGSCEPVFCPPLPAVKYATAPDAVEVRVGTDVTYTCTYGYRFSDTWHTTRVIRCEEESVWSETPPPCEEIHCGDPPDVLNSQKIYINDTLDSTVKYTCMPTHRFLDGYNEKVALCMSDSQWLNLEDTCEPDRCYPPPVLQTATRSTVNASFGSVVDYACIEGYVFPNLVPTRSITCHSSMTWSEDPPECQEVRCPTLAYIPHLKYDTSVHAMYNTVLKVSCEHGYMFADTARYKIITCLATAEWNMTFTDDTCQTITCPATRLIRYGWRTTSANIYDTRLTVYCRLGYYLPNVRHTNIDVICEEDGQWSKPVPTACQLVTCQGLPDWNVVLNSTDNSVNSVVNYTCPNGTRFADLSTVKYSTCQINGYWKPPFDECIDLGNITVEIPVEEARGSKSIGALAIALLSTVLLLIVTLDIVTLGKDISICTRS